MLIIRAGWENVDGMNSDLSQVTEKELKMKQHLRASIMAIQCAHALTHTSM